MDVAFGISAFTKIILFMTIPYIKIRPNLTFRKTNIFKLIFRMITSNLRLVKNLQC